jgi:acetolactate synthase small subunit
LVRSYNNLVEDATRVMQRIKAMFRARAIATKGTAIYRPSERAQWLAQLTRRVAGSKEVAVRSGDAT